MMVWWSAIRQQRRAAAVVLSGLSFAVLYWGAALLAWRTPRALWPGTPDAIIPFVPGAIWIYLSEFLLVGVAIWVADPIGRSRVLLASAAALVTASLAFVLVPTTVPRESPDVAGITGLVWHLLYAVDTPNNALPSLHAALAVPAAAALWRRGGPWRVVGPLWSVAILFAALATKQHFVADLSAGFVLGALAQVLSVILVPARQGSAGNDSR